MSRDPEIIEVAPAGRSILRPMALVALALIVLTLMKIGSSVAGPFLFFIFLAILIVPLYQALKKRGVSSGLALIIMLLGLTVIFIGLGLLVVTSFIQLANSLGQYNTGFEINTEEIAQYLETIRLDAETVQGIGKVVFQVLLTVIQNVVTNTVNLVMGGVITLVALAFIMLESEAFSKRLQLGLADNVSLLGRMRIFQGSLFSYVIARVKLNFLTGLGVFVMLIIFGIDYPILWSVLAFLLSFIPYIGLLTAMIPPIMLGIAESGWVTGLVLAIGYFIINQVIEQIVEPRVVGKQMTLSPTLTLFSVIFWTWILGPIGAMLAGPLAALMILIFGAFDDTRWLAILFSSEDSPLVAGLMPEEESTAESDAGAAADA